MQANFLKGRIPSVTVQRLRGYERSGIELDELIPHSRKATPNPEDGFGFLGDAMRHAPCGTCPPKQELRRTDAAF